MKPELLGFVAAAAIVVPFVLWFIAAKRREWAQEDAEDEDNMARTRAMSGLAAHAILLGYTVEITKRNFAFGPKGGGNVLLVELCDFSPTALLAALKDLPPAPAPVPAAAPTTPTSTA